jgi:hypothetical protein
MSGGIRAECAVCAWRGDCQKQHAARETVLHCRDFSRDARLGIPPEQEGPREKHKRVEDVFGDSKNG